MPQRTPYHSSKAKGRTVHTKPRESRFYDKRAWRRLRAWYIAKHPLCVKCETAGLVVAAVDVDHIKPITERPDLALKSSNLQALCKACHVRKRREEL